VRAEREAERAWQGDSARGLAALIGARAAHQLRETGRRDRWFARAESVGSESLNAARLVSRAELALDDRDYSTAREALTSLHDSGPRHIATLRMLIRAERGAGNWEEVLRLASMLAKRDALAPGLAEEYRVQAILELLARDASDRRALEERWRKVSAHDQTLPRVARRPLRRGHLPRKGNASLAREVIERADSKRIGRPSWLRCTGAARGGWLSPNAASKRAARIERGERWLLRGRSIRCAAARDAGTLCAQVELWGRRELPSR
jgi:HemY protein